MDLGTTQNGNFGRGQNAVNKNNIQMVDQSSKVSDGLDKNTDVLRKSIETKGDKK